MPAAAAPPDPWPGSLLPAAAASPMCAASRQAACISGCIPVPWLCDGEQQCPDGTDEQCGRSCFVRNGGCAETCTDTHWGVQCSCGAGWVLQADGQSCADVDECSLEYSPCSQLCTNTPGTFSCACLQGYTLRHGTACEVADNSTQILVAVGQDLAVLDVRTQAYRPLLSTETEPRALVYDLLQETYYWLTEDGELRVHHPGQGTQPLYADAGEVNSISVDWFTGQLYWASSHPPAICAGLGDGRGYVTVLGKDIAPEQLTVHPAARSLYWVNRGQRGRTVIAAAGMDGSNWRELTVVSMEEPVGLSLDHVAGRLYWISEYKESIETLRVDGSGRHSFHAVLRSHTEPLGLAVFESRFFWTDGTELVSATWASPQDHAVLLRASISAFTVLHALQQPPSEYLQALHCCRAGSMAATPTNPWVLGKAHWVLELTRSCPMGTLLHVLWACVVTYASCPLCILGATKLSIVYASEKAISLVHVGPGTHAKQVQEWQEPFHLQDVDWQRSVLYGTDDHGTLLHVVGHPGRREAIVTGLPVCSARVDIRSGDLYWLACNRRDIGVIRTSDKSPRILHRARSSIQHLFLDWQRGALYWLARLQALSLTKRQAVTLAPSWSHGLMAAFEPYLVSANGTALLLWDRRTLALVLSLPAVGVQGVVAFVGSEVQTGCLATAGHVGCCGRCLECGEGMVPTNSKSSASVTKQRVCRATPSTCDHHYEDNHKHHCCSAYHLYHNTTAKPDHHCTQHYSCTNQQGYHITNHQQTAHIKEDHLCTNHCPDHTDQDYHCPASHQHHSIFYN
ncbi:Prolow-density lipoprotein receptor-related protein 1 [Lonchura striata]|uniref:Prolow-density lipoprotein receptor-related protein 1 n=1 Tax=Lonchura striata TaxID=40157 RepID=A0A218UMY6_9PASE|nr:Prolow-density lipoprotein receptor-related protein 1 [Lonchura striata domestica]